MRGSPAPLFLIALAIVLVQVLVLSGSSWPLHVLLGFIALLLGLGGLGRLSGREPERGSLELPGGPLQTIDERTSASNPGRAALSLDRLAVFHPYLASGDAAKHPADAAYFAKVGREYGLRAISEHLAAGDCRAAVVSAMSDKALVVAAYSDDFDACVFLYAGPEATRALTRRYGLKPGSRLITCNTYMHPAAEATLQTDIHPGPAATGSPWTGFWPVIVDFLSDDQAQLSALHAGISEREWARAAELSSAEYEGGIHLRPMEPFRSRHAGIPLRPGAS